MPLQKEKLVLNRHNDHCRVAGATPPIEFGYVVVDHRDQDMTMGY